MNIQNNELMILDRIRFRAGENAPQAPVPTPVETEQSAEKGMNALSFMGAKNLISNPGLAHTIKNYSMAALIALAGAGITSATLASCSPEPTKVEQKTEVNVTVDQEQIAMLQAILAELQAMGADIKSIKEYSAEYRDNFSKIISLVSDLYTLSKQEAVDNETFRKKVLERYDSIIFLAEQQGIKTDAANALLQKILDSNLSIEEKTAAIQALVTDIRNMVAKGLTYMEQAEKDRASLKAYAKGTYINSKALVNYAKQALASDSIQIANQEAMLDKFDVLHVDVNSGIERLSQELNIDHEELVTLLKKMGYTQAQITIMTAADIKEAIKKNTKVTKEEDQKILDAINKVDTDLNAAKTEIVEVLDRIDGHIVDLTNAVKDGIKMQKKQNFIANAYAQQIAFNTGVTAYNQGITNIKLDKLNEAVNNVTIDNSDLAEKFDSLYVAIKTADENNQLGDASIVKAIEALTAFGISQAKLEAMSNEEILAELKKQTELLKESAATLKDLKKQQADGIISAKEYATKVIDILSGLKQDVASLALAIGDLSVNVEAATNKYDDALEAIKNNTQNTAFYVKKLYEAYENRAADIIALKTGMEELKPLLKNIDGTTTNIYQYLVNQGIDKDDIDRILKAIAKSSGDQIDASNANTTKILNAIDKADAKLDAQLQVEQEILAKMNDLANNTSPTNVDLSKVEKGLADILAAIRGLDISNPNYTSLLEEIRDKIKPCNCNCGELKVVVEEIKTIIEQRNSDEGIRNPNGGLIS